MEQRGELQAVLADIGVYRRADVESFVQWSRSTIKKLRDTTDRAVSRARRAEGALADAERRAAAAEARSAELEREVIEAERAAAGRERDLQASVGRAVLMVQQLADSPVRVSDAVPPAPAPAPWSGEALWATTADDPLLTPMREMQAASGA